MSLVSPAQCVHHCEFWEGLWLQREAALQTISFRDAEPQPVFPPNAKKNPGISLKQLGPGMNINLTTTNPFLPKQLFQGFILLRDLFPNRKAQLTFEMHNKVGRKGWVTITLFFSV